MNTCLCYYAFRFRPINLHSALYPDLASQILQICDLIFGSGLLLTAITSFFMGLVMITGLTHADISTGIAPLVGSIGLLMMSVYPIHLLLGGEDWISCIVEEYPAQREAFSGYVFVPTSFVVCAMFFGVTLLGRFVSWNYPHIGWTIPATVDIDTFRLYTTQHIQIAYIILEKFLRQSNMQ